MCEFYYYFILAVILAEFVLNFLTDWLNSHAANCTLPAEFVACYDADKYAKSQLYLKTNIRFGWLKGGCQTLLTLIFLYTGWFGQFHQWVNTLTDAVIWQGLIFIGYLSLASMALSLPFSVYHTFVIEEQFGFNRTTPQTFVMDLVKGLILTILIGGLILALVLWFFNVAGPLAWLYCWLAVTAIQLFFMYVAPVWIMPLFNTFTPLEDGELKKSIEKYAKQYDFALQGIYVTDGSKRSSKANAYFTGFGKYRRIVLFDTLIEKQSVEELTAVLAHEMGHFKKKHIQKGVITSLLTTAATLYLLSLFLNQPAVATAFGLKEPTVHAGLVLFGFVFSPISLILGICSSWVSRKHEFEADAYAADTYGKPEALISALKKLTVESLGNLTPHPLKVFLEYSHPPVLARIEALRKK